MAESDNLNQTEKLRMILETADAAGALTEPLTDSIKNFLKLTAHALNSEEASVITRDGDSGDLKFLAAVGKVADRLTGLQIPAGKGIAGFVFSSGQPMAVADVGQEESFYAEVDKRTGYSTQTILATPLRYKGEVIGVLEYINRIGAPPYRPFTPEEMDQAAIYAEAIAALLNAYESAHVLYKFGEKIFADGNIGEPQIKDWIENMRSTAEHREMIALATLVREVSTRGVAERRLCTEILESFLRYSESGSETSFLSF
jgi:signal transduction protein with GAF and PtsI domain